jgi:hypothetical protein
MVTVQVFTLPLPSVAVKVTVVVPAGKLAYTMSPKLINITPLSADWAVLDTDTLSTHVGLAMDTAATQELGPALNVWVDPQLYPFTEGELDEDVLDTEGGIRSTTKTVAFVVELLPFSSVTVNTTVLEPKSDEVKLDGLTDLFTIPQLSVDPPSTAAANKVACPFTSK